MVLLVRLPVSNLLIVLWWFQVIVLDRELDLEAWELLDQSSDFGNCKTYCMTLCEWQKPTVFPYHWLFSGEMTRNDAYLKQMLLDCITVKNGKNSCSQAVSIHRWLSGQFISCPTEDTESLALVANCHLSYCCFEFPHLPNAAMADAHAFLNKLNFSYFLSSYASISFSLPFCHADLTSSPLFFLFSYLCFFSLSFLPLYCFLSLFPHSILSSFPFLSFTFPLSSFYHYILSLFFLSTQYFNKTFDHLNIFCLCSSGFWIIAIVLPKLNYHIKEELSSFRQDFSLSRFFLTHLT